MADSAFVNIGGHKVSAGKKYSTTEVKTGDVWIDGKPIYRLVLSGSVVSTGATNQNFDIMAYASLNIDTFVKTGGSLHRKAPNYWWTGIPYAYGGGGQGSNPFLYQDYIKLNVIGLASDTYYYNIILEYTKTTD